MEWLQEMAFPRLTEELLPSHDAEFVGDIFIDQKRKYTQGRIKYLVNNYDFS